MNRAERIIESAQNEWRSPKPGLDPCVTEAEHIAHRLRSAGIDLDHTYEEAHVSGFLPFFECGEVAGIKATIRLIPDDRNITPLVAYVRRSLDGAA